MTGPLEVQHSPGRDSAPAAPTQPVFLYDLASPECYLAPSTATTLSAAS